VLCTKKNEQNDFDVVSTIYFGFYYILCSRESVNDDQIKILIKSNQRYKNMRDDRDTKNIKI
jgi:hypothetical protein